MYSGGAAQFRARLERKHQKSSRPCQPDAAQGRELKLPWYHLGSQHPHRCCLKTAAEKFLLTAGRFNGRTRRRLSTLVLRPRGSKTIFGSLFPALFHLPGSLVRLNAKAYSSFHSHFCDIAFILINLSSFVNPLKQTFLVGKSKNPRTAKYCPGISIFVGQIDRPLVFATSPYQNVLSFGIRRPVG